MSKRKLLGFELGAPPHVQIRRVFVCTSRVKELQRCENTDIAVKCYSYWRRDPRVDSAFETAETVLHLLGPGESLVSVNVTVTNLTYRRSRSMQSRSCRVKQSTSCTSLCSQLFNGVLMMKIH